LLKVIVTVFRMNHAQDRRRQEALREQPPGSPASRTRPASRPYDSRFGGGT